MQFKDLPVGAKFYDMSLPSDVVNTKQIDACVNYPGKGTFADGEGITRLIYSENPVIWIRNARFWEYHNGDWVKITLKPKQELSIDHGGQHEEGHWRSYCSWKNDINRVIRYNCVSGSDCDGRYRRDWTDCCPIGELQQMPHENAPGPTPNWRNVSESQRDFTAEFMNY